MATSRALDLKDSYPERQREIVQPLFSDVDMAVITIVVEFKWAEGNVLSGDEI